MGYPVYAFTFSYIKQRIERKEKTLLCSVGKNRTQTAFIHVRFITVYKNCHDLLTHVI
jgi:hypothetical protein